MRGMDALPQVVEEKLEEVRALCRKYYVRKLSIFGSAVKGTFDPERSDLDFLVEFEWDADPLVRGRRYLGLWRALKLSFGRPVDLVESFSVGQNPYFAEAVRMTERALYAAA